MGALLAATGLFVLLRFEAELDAGLEQTLRSRAAAARAPPGREEESFVQVIGPAGDVIAGAPPVPALTRAQLARARREPLLLDRGPPPGLDDPVRLLARPDGRDVVVAGVSRDDRDEAVGSLRALLLIGGPAALLLASLAGYALASAALRPVESMRRRAAQISRLEAGSRLPGPPARDELAELADTLNEMLDRLERSAERERAFVANASHELRTPLALLRGELELALRERRSPEALRAALASAAEETDRLAQLAEDLLVLARSDQGQLPIRIEPLDAEEQLERARRRFELRAREAGRALRVDADGHPLLAADPLRLQQALGNLVDNALRHGAGAVILTARERAGEVELHVRDEGPGFADDVLPSAFERFTGRDAGLGLAIVEAIAAAHGGRAHARNEPGGGADVWISLPHGDLIRPP
jgi:two-component system OmpR family sensor kinase